MHKNNISNLIYDKISRKDLKSVLINIKYTLFLCPKFQRTKQYIWYNIHNIKTYRKSEVYHGTKKGNLRTGYK